MHKFKIEDLRVVADIVKNKKVAKNIKSAIIVPGSGLVKEELKKKAWIKYLKNLALNGEAPVVQCA